MEKNRSLWLLVLHTINLWIILSKSTAIHIFKIIVIDGRFEFWKKSTWSEPHSHFLLKFQNLFTSSGHFEIVAHLSIPHMHWLAKKYQIITVTWNLIRETLLVLITLISVSKASLMQDKDYFSLHSILKDGSRKKTPRTQFSYLKKT